MRFYSRRSRLGSDRGVQLFEFAMILPVFCMLLVGMVFGGILLYDYVTLADAVAAGARTLATSRGVTLTGTSTVCTLAQSMVQASVASLNPHNATPSPVTVPAPTFTGTGGSTCSKLVEGDWGTITASYACSVPIPFTTVNLCPPTGISSSTTVRIE
jgi:Flp pilus assembly protein TadG